MNKLLLTGAFKYSQKQLNILENLGYNIIFIQDEREKLTIDVADIDAVVCNSLFLHNDINNFTSLKFIQLTSAGLDRVPFDYIYKNDIQLFSAKGVYSIPMAEWTVLKILEIYKKSHFFYENQRLHKWEKQRDLFELTGKTASIIGYGEVGYEISKRLKAFDMNIISVARRKHENKYIDEAFLIDDIEKVLRKSDVVIFTLPLKDETKHILNEDKMRIMKDNSIIVNVSRGGIIDETALVNFLKEDKFLGVALDVFEKEPLSNSFLWEFEKVIITPHNSFVSDKVNERLFKLILSNITK